MNYLKEIENKRHETAELIRDHVRSQKELWQKIPYLALQVEAFCGDFSKFEDKGSIGKIYIHGLWYVFISSLPSFLEIDCVTGELLMRPVKGPKFQKATDHLILLLDLEKIEKFDAQKIINDLNLKLSRKRKIDIPMKLGLSVYIRDNWVSFRADTQEEWFKKMAKICRVKENFERKTKLII